MYHGKPLNPFMRAIGPAIREIQLAHFQKAQASAAAAAQLLPQPPQPQPGPSTAQPPQRP